MHLGNKFWETKNFISFVLYPLSTITSVICPILLIVNLINAPLPTPSIWKVGGTLYPLPGLIIFALIIVPLLMISLSSACCTLLVLTNLRSLSLSITKSYLFDDSVGADSFCKSPDKL